VDKNHDPYNIAFLKYLLAAAVLYYSGDYVFGDDIRQMFVTSRDINLVQAGFVALIVDILAAASILIERITSPLRTFLVKIGMDIFVLIGVFYTRSVVNLETGSAGQSGWEFIYFATLAAAFLMFAASAYMVVAHIMRR